MQRSLHETIFSYTGTNISLLRFFLLYFLSAVLLEEAWRVWRIRKGLSPDDIFVPDAFLLMIYLCGFHAAPITMTCFTVKCASI